MQSLRGITQLSLILILFVAELAFPTSKIFETRYKVFVKQQNEIYGQPYLFKFDSFPITLS